MNCCHVQMQVRLITDENSSLVVHCWIFYFPFQIPACWQLAAHIGAQQRGPRRQLGEGQDQEVAPKDGQVPQRHHLHELQTAK